jgi:hypothetical protein
VKLWLQLQKTLIKENKMINLRKNDALADAVKNILQQEALKGNQKNIDKNHNGKIDGEDFKILRGEKKEKKKEVSEETVEIVYEANIQPTSAKSRSHIGNLSNPNVNSVQHSGKQIGLITKQPSGEYHAHHSAAKLAHSQSSTFDSKDKAHQFIRNAHAKAIKSGTLSDRFLKKEEVETVEEGLKDMAKKAFKAVTGGSDEDQRKNLQKKMGLPQTGKKPTPQKEEVQGKTLKQFKEGFEEMLADVKKRNEPQPNGGSGKKQGSRYGGSKQKDKPEQDTEKK